MLICRLCGDENVDVQDLFRDGNITELRSLHRMIRALFSIRVRSTDFSTSVCKKCVQLVNEFHLFHCKVRSVNENLSRKKSILTVDNESKKTSLEEEKLKIEESDELLEPKLHFIKEENLFENNEFNQLARNTIFVQDIEMKPNINVLMEDKFAPELSVYQSDDDNSNFNNSDVDEKTEKNGKESVKSIKKIDKHVLKKRKLKKKNKEYIDEDDNVKLLEVINNHDDYTFPTEIIKDGKLIIKGSSLAFLIAKFYNLHCNICSDLPKFNNLSKLMKHYDLTHNIQGYVTCCNAQFHQHRSIYMHMARHLQPSAFECPICKKAVSRPHSLKLHLQTHLPEAEKPHQCDECSRRFSYIDGLINHKRTHVPIEERETFYCQICGKMFTLASSFATHMRSIHSGAKYLCSDCGRSFRRKTELTFHMLTHDATGKNRVKCQQCGFICKNLPTLKVHMKRHSNDQLKCPICAYTTHRRQQLNIHMRVKHSDEKPYCCVVCNKQFKLKNVLMTHMAQHTGEHKYSCTFCPKKFASPGNYHSHRKRMHAEEHKNERLMKQKEQYEKIEAPQENSVEDKSLVHEVARSCLKKIAENNMTRKTAAL